MTDHHRRRKATAGEATAALGLAVGAGLATFYLVRTLLARDPLPPPRPRDESPGGRRVDADAGAPSAPDVPTGSGPEAA